MQAVSGTSVEILNMGTTGDTFLNDGQSAVIDETVSPSFSLGGASGSGSTWRTFLALSLGISYQISTETTPSTIGRSVTSTQACTHYTQWNSRPTLMERLLMLVRSL